MCDADSAVCLHFAKWSICYVLKENLPAKKTRELALASMARDDPPTSSTAAAMRGKVGSEFETLIGYNAPMHFRHKQTDRQTDTDIVA